MGCPRVAGKPGRCDRHLSSARRVAGGSPGKAWSAAWMGVGENPFAPPCNLLKQHNDAGWSSSVARWAHNPEVAGSNPVPATEERAVASYLATALFVFYP